MKRASVLGFVCLALACAVAPAAAAEPDQPPADLTAQPACSTEAAPSYACFGKTCPGPFTPLMFGDLVGPFRLPTLTTAQFVDLSRQAGEIASARGAFKIAENESVRPQNRLYFNHNYYANVRGNIDEIHRFTLGIEKTILDGSTSVGVRVPFFHVDRTCDVPAFEEETTGDISIVFKYAAINEAERVLSGGLVLTTPSSPEPTFILPGGEEVHATLLQPYVGYYRNVNGWFLHGFSSVMISMDGDDVSLLFNDIGVGYRLARSAEGATLQEVVPSFEVHVNTPLNHRSPGDLSRFRDSVELTAGTHFVFTRSALGLALAVPVVAPRAFDIEVIVNFNWRF